MRGWILKFILVGGLVVWHSAPGADNLKAQLGRGELPIDFIENYKVVPPDSPEGKEFQEQMEKIAKMIYPDHDFTKQPFRFVLVDNPSVNAFSVRFAKPPILGFNKGLLQKTSSANVVAWLIGHEWNHSNFRKIYGQKFGNTKGEEMASDLLPLYRLGENGYDPVPTLKFMKENFPRGFGISEILDEHSPTPLREQTLADFLAIYSKHRGGFADLKAIDLPPTFAPMIQGASHTGHVRKSLVEQGYDSKSTAEKLALLSQQVQRETHWNSARAGDLIAEIKRLKIDRTDEEQRTAQNNLVGAAFERMKREKPAAKGEFVFPEVRLRDAIANATSRWGTDEQRWVDLERPDLNLGRHRALADAIQDFVEAKTKREAVTAANRVLKLRPTSGVELKHVLDTVRLPNFPLPNEDRLDRGKAARAPWNPHIEWMREDSTDNIARVMLSLGIRDPRIFAELSNELSRDLYLSRLPEIARPPRSEAFFLPDLFIDGEGRVRKDKESGFVKFPSTDKDRAKSRLYVQELYLEAMHNGGGKQFLEAEQAKKELDVQGSRVFGVEGDSDREDKKMSLEEAKQDERFLNDVFESFPKNPQLAIRVWRAWGEITLSNHNATQLLAGWRAIENGSDKAKKQQLRDFLIAEASGKSYTGWSDAERSIGTRRDKITPSQNPVILFVLQTPLLTKPEKENFFLRFNLLDEEKLPTSEQIEPFLKAWEISPSSSLFEAIKAGVAAKNGSEFERSLRHMEILLKLGVTPDLDYPGLGGSHPSQMELSALLHYWDPSSYYMHSELKRRLSKRMESYVFPEDVEALVEDWGRIHEFGLFSASSSRENEVLSTILKKIGTVPDREMKLRLLESVLRRKTIRDATTREGFVKEWATLIAASLGKDDRSPDYLKRLLEILDRNDKFDRETKREAFESLSLKIVSQEKASSEIGKRVTKIDAQTLAKSQHHGSRFEGSLFLAARKPKERKLTIEFLLSPGEPKDRAHFTQGMEEAINTFFDDWGKDDIATRSTESFHFNDRQKRRFENDAKDFHENFWSRPFLARALLLERVLFPEGTVKLEGSEAYASIIDLLFPSNRPYAAEARKFLDAYIRALPEYEHNLFVAALLVTAEQSKSKQDTSVGTKLALLLENMGPAETKLGQAIQSHPNTPSDIKFDLKRLKSMANLPNRWQLFQEMNEQVPASVRRNIRSVLEVLGSGSYYTVVLVEMKDGSQRALRFLRPRALERAENGFRHLEGMLENLKGSFSPEELSSVQQMIRQGAEKAKFEVDVKHGHEQFKVQQALYDGASVTADGQTFDFKVVPIVGKVGQSHFFMEVAPGVHFLDLPLEPIPDTGTNRKAAAKAYLTYELYLLLRGHHFDDDRHGAQMKISGNTIYLFDPGGIELREYSSTERAMLGDVLFEVVEGVLDGKDLQDIVFKAIKARQNQGLDIRYLLRIQTALLKLQDYISVIPKSELVDTLKAILPHGIHPDFQKALQSKAFASGNLMKFMPLLSEGECSIVLKRIATGIRKPN